MVIGMLCIVFGLLSRAHFLRNFAFSFRLAHLVTLVVLCILSVGVTVLRDVADLQHDNVELMTTIAYQRTLAMQLTYLTSIRSHHGSTAFNSPQYDRLVEELTLELHKGNTLLLGMSDSPAARRSDSQLERLLYLCQAGHADSADTDIRLFEASRLYSQTITEVVLTTFRDESPFITTSQLLVLSAIIVCAWLIAVCYLWQVISHG